LHTARSTTTATRVGAPCDSHNGTKSSGATAACAAQPAHVAGAIVGTPTTTAGIKNGGTCNVRSKSSTTPASDTVAIDTVDRLV